MEVSPSPSLSFEGKTTKLGHLILLFVVLASVLSDCSEANKLSYFPDCMKNPFAASCRGISAKRSIPQQQDQNTVGQIYELAPSQQEIWQSELAAWVKTNPLAISHRTGLQPRTLYQLLMPMPINLNLRAFPWQQLNNNNIPADWSNSITRG